MELYDFLLCAENEMNDFQRNLPEKGLEYCKTHLNSAGRDLMLAEINGGRSKENRGRYESLRQRLQSLIDSSSNT